MSEQSSPASPASATPSATPPPKGSAPGRRGAPKSAFGGSTINASRTLAHPLTPKPPAQQTWVSFGTRLPPDVLRRLRVTAVVRGVSVQQATHDAVHAWLDQGEQP